MSHIAVLVLPVVRSVPGTSTGTYGTALYQVQVPLLAQHVLPLPMSLTRKKTKQKKKGNDHDNKTEKKRQNRTTKKANAAQRIGKESPQKGRFD